MMDKANHWIRSGKVTSGLNSVSNRIKFITNVEQQFLKSTGQNILLFLLMSIQSWVQRPGS